VAPDGAAPHCGALTSTIGRVPSPTRIGLMLLSVLALAGCGASAAARPVAKATDSPAAVSAPEVSESQVSPGPTALPSVVGSVAVPASTPAASPSVVKPRAGGAAPPLTTGDDAAAHLASAQNLPDLSGKTIVIDPGHNGGNGAHPEIINKQVQMGAGTKACDTTGTSTNAGYSEAAFTFDVATRLAALLRAAGAIVMLTRTDNTGVGPCVDRRAAIGNDAHAAAAISIHGDGAPTAGHGFHVLEPTPIGAPSDAIIAPSHVLALRVRDSYRDHTGIPTSTYIGSNGINPRSDMAGLNLSTVPKVMVECGNMRNSGDAAFMASANGRQRAAEGIAAGLAGFLAGT
jgi:N-acetylmuramoyl-L-alanine amidase